MAILSKSYFVWADLFRRRKGVQDTVTGALRQNVLFSTLTERELQYVAKMTYERVYEQGEVIFKEGKSGFGLYIITKGEVEIQVHGKEGLVPIVTLSKGNFFGEMALLEEDNVRSASAVALEKSVLIGFFKADLLEILARQPATGAKIILQLARVLSHRLLETTQKLPEQVAHESAD